MMIPGSRDTMRQFSISYLFIFSVIAIVVGLFIANIFLTASFIESQSAENRINQLETENKFLVEKYEELNTQVTDINNLYSDLIEKEIVIRNIFNLPEISHDERQLGIGGPEQIVDENLSESIKLAYKTQSDVNALLRLSKFENEKYEEVFGTLVEKKSILDHTPSIMPCKGYKTRGFGMKFDPFTGYKRFHGGLDISNKTGTPIYATADGVVQFAGNTGGDFCL